MFDSDETEKRLSEACKRVIVALVNGDEENADLVKKDMQMLKEELIPVVLEHEEEHVRELGKLLQSQMERFGL